MNIPVPSIPVPPKLASIAAIVGIAIIVGAYLIYLYASWNQFEKANAVRNEKINTILDRLPIIPENTNGN